MVPKTNTVELSVAGRVALAYRDQDAAQAIEICCKSRSRGLDTVFRYASDLLGRRYWA